MQLIDFDVVVLVTVNLFKDLLKCKSSLFEDFDQVIEYFILGKTIFAFFLYAVDFRFVVTVVEDVQLSILDDAVFIRVDLLEKLPDFGGLETQVEVFAKIDLEVSQGEESNFVRVKDGEGCLKIHRLLDPLLDGFKHSERLHLLVHLRLNSLVRLVDVMTRHLLQLRYLNALEHT